MENNKKVKKQVKRGLWKPEEDLMLRKYVEKHGEGNWSAVSTKSGLMRGGKSCRLRWKNYLRPNIKRGGMSQEEEDLIIRMHKLLGNRWSLIAGRLPGRTDNEVKNYWNTHLNRKYSPGKRKTKCSNNMSNGTDDQTKDTQIKRGCKFSNSQQTCNNNETASITQDTNRGKQDEEEIIVNDCWLPNSEEINVNGCWLPDSEGLNYYFEPPMLLPADDEASWFEVDPFVSYVDSSVLFESLACIGEENMQR